MTTLSPKQLRFSVFAGLVGNTLEWYEFSLYVQFAPLFSLLFFHEDTTPVFALIQTLMIFALGFLARPIGALFFGHIGDKKGRRKALISSVLIMTAPTFLIGFLPTYVQLGLIAPLLLAFLRLLQGIPTGGEFPGAMCYLVEIAPKQSRGFMGSWAYFGSQLGSILSTFEYLFLKNHFSTEALMKWGWRLSFIVGGLIGLGGFYLRRRLLESPHFEKVKREREIVKTPVLDLFKHYKLPLAKAFFLCVLPLGGWYLVFVFSPIYLSHVLEISYRQDLLINGCMLILSNLFLPVFGKWADKTHKKPLLIFSAIAIIILSYPLYFYIIQKSFAIFLIVESITVLLITIQSALLPQLLSELFPTQVRYTGVGISYTLCNIFFGGAAPMLALTLTHMLNNPFVPAFMLMATAMLSLAALLSIREKEVRL